MIEFLTANWGNIIVGLIVLAILTAVTVKLVRDRKNKKASCSCACGGCELSGVCRQGKSDESASPTIEIKKSGHKPLA